MEKYLVSACLLGCKTRYNGKSCKNKKVLSLLKKAILVPVCPEQLGGLPTPREKIEILGRRAITEKGKDVSLYLKRGAEEVLKIAKVLKIKKAILKQYSPSCGWKKVYDGTFRGKIIKGEGFTAKLLKKNKIQIISEEDL